MSGLSGAVGEWASAPVLVLLAAALLCCPQSRWHVYRVVEPPPRRRSEPWWLGVDRGDDPFAVAAGLDLFAVCLRAGLPVASAARVVADTAPASLSEPLAATADLLELGADPERAWVAFQPSSGRRSKEKAAAERCFDDLAALARRSARAGSALADGVAELAVDVRRRAHDHALARAERAGVMVSGPLGLCFLPAFICLGIVPVVIGLATQTLGGL